MLWIGGWDGDGEDGTHLHCVFDVCEAETNLMQPPLSGMCAVYPVYTVHTANTMHTVHTVHTVHTEHTAHTMYTVHTVHTMHAFRSSHVLAGRIPKNAGG